MNRAVAARIATRLTAAADLVERCGWWRSAMWPGWPRPHNGREPVCAFGAILATGWVGAQVHVDSDSCRAVLDRLLIQPDRADGDFGLIYWNDCRAESAAQVIELLRRGAAHAATFAAVP
jgi:hypothetical protein